ncbi:GNAT family N-acetyltransferase [Ostreiculturibacter nitratireducens]|uniref:GNAT family N-acetyltransferase n=1 Tax=Ostreiculturibacter nitratireducens TaxID=3075226 RepID=UPI0031B59CE9
MSPEDLAALHSRCFTAPRPWGAGEFASLLSQPSVFLLEEGQGFILGRVVAGEAELLTLAVAPEARRRGLGRALLSRFDETARTRGAEDAFLEVAENNAAARALYAAAGWKPAGRRRGYVTGLDGRSVDALVLGKRIAPVPSET